jgi:hypothetical protein
MADPIRYELKKETDWTVTIPLIIWAVCLICMTVFLILQNILDPRYQLDFIPIILVMIFFAFHVVNVIRWQLFGREVVILDDNGMEIENIGTFYNDHIKISYNEMDGISYDGGEKRSIISLWSFGMGGGKIVIQYLGRIRRVGQSITIYQAEGLANEMRKEFEQRKNEYKQPDFLKN